MYQIMSWHEMDESLNCDLSEGDIQPRSVVSLEAFFTGNDKPGTVGCLVPELYPDSLLFYELLKKLRNQEEVENMVVEISGVEIKEIGDKFMWPHSERVYIITSASQEDVSEWVAPLKPDEISEGWQYGVAHYSVPEVSEANKVFALYWGYE